MLCRERRWALIADEVFVDYPLDVQNPLTDLATRADVWVNGWWPGDPRYPRAAFYAYAHPAPAGFESATLSPAAARWEPSLGEYLLDWDDVRSAPDPHRAALEFARSAVEHGCAVCDWDPELAGSLSGSPPPVR